MAAKKKVTTKKQPAKRGRPTKFKEEHITKIQKMATAGFTDAEMASCLNVTEQTLNNWKNKNKDFFESLKDWKLRADDDIERSLYERAKGYSCRETKVFNNMGDIVTEDVIKHYPPDTTACIYWLKNRKPKQWRDKPVEEEGNALVNALESINTLSQMINQPRPNRNIEDA